MTEWTLPCCYILAAAKSQPSCTVSSASATAAADVKVPLAGKYLRGSDRGAESRCTIHVVWWWKLRVARGKCGLRNYTGAREEDVDFGHLFSLDSSHDIFFKFSVSQLRCLGPFFLSTELQRAGEEQFGLPERLCGPSVRRHTCEGGCCLSWQLLSRPVGLIDCQTSAHEKANQMGEETGLCSWKLNHLSSSPLLLPLALMVPPPSSYQCAAGEII